MTVREGYEIERKFLIKLPSEDELLSVTGSMQKRIVQTYLKNGADGEERRVRRITENRTEDSAEIFVYTEKVTKSKTTRLEYEREISSEEYLSLYRQAVSELTKTRTVIPYLGHNIEIDVYPYDIGGDELDGYAVMEVELENENESFAIPKFITVVRELTGTRQFSNKVLAKPIK